MGKFSSQNPPVITQIPHRVRGASNSIGLEAINHRGRGMVCHFFMFLYVSNGWTHVQKAACTHQTGPGSFQSSQSFLTQGVSSPPAVPTITLLWDGNTGEAMLLKRHIQARCFVIEKKTCRFYRWIDRKKKNASVSALQLHRWVFVSITVSDMNFSRLRLSAVPPEATMLPKKPTLLRKLSAIFTVCQLIIIWLIALVYNITWTDASGLFCINCANFPERRGVKTNLLYQQILCFNL